MSGWVLETGQTAYWILEVSCGVAKQKVVTSSDRPSYFDLMRFYEHLFSHEDRLSNDRHKDVQRQVSEYASSIINKKFHAKFSRPEIHDALIGLKNGKAAGFDSLSNESFKA